MRSVGSIVDQHLDALLESALGVTWPNPNAAHAADARIADIELDWLRATQSLVQQTRKPLRDPQLADKIARMESAVSDRGATALIRERLNVCETPEFYPDDRRDFYYFKINHGFWEALYWSHARAFNKKLMRGHDLERTSASYVASGFTAGLQAMISKAAQVEGANVSFPGVCFGVNLFNGMVAHKQFISDFDALPALERRVVTGATIGATAAFETLFGQRSVDLADGSFPKLGLMTGALRATLRRFAEAADEILFVVPPHLSAIQLAGARCSQDQYCVSGRSVHESWIATLRASACRVCDKLEGGKRLLVITQSAVLSAMLGFLLKQTKGEAAPGSRLFFFDLGQALDIANPAAGGPFLRNYQVTDTTLFVNGAAP